MDVITPVIIVVLVPILLISYAQRNRAGKTGTGPGREGGGAFAPIICSRCSVELRGWNSSGKKQMWTRPAADGSKIYFCARCKNK